MSQIEACRDFAKRALPSGASTAHSTSIPSGRAGFSEAMAEGSQAAAADALGVSAQAVSQVLHAAGWSEAERGRELSAWLLEHA